MTCKDCKCYLPYKHDFNCPVLGNRSFEGICRYEPETFHKNGNMWCSKWKNKVAPVKRGARKPKIPLDFEDDATFMRFKAAYPRNKLMNKAYKVWLELPEKHYEHIITQAGNYTKECETMKRDTEFISYPGNWLSDGGWKDNYEESEDSRHCEDCGAPYQDHWKYYGTKGKKKLYRCDECKSNITGVR